MLMIIQGGVHRDGVKKSPEEIDILISKIAQGDQEAFHQLYEETRGAVYGFALSFLKSPQDAEDVMQESYISIYQSAISYRTQGKPMAWILRIVRNYALLRLRDKKKHHAMSTEEMSYWLEGEEEMNQEDKIVLEAALTVLDEDERQIVTLHGIAGMKHREIATLLDMKLATVLSKYRRSLQKLRKELEGGVS